MTDAANFAPSLRFTTMSSLLRSLLFWSSVVAASATVIGCFERTAGPGGSAAGSGSAAATAVAVPTAPPPLREKFESVSWQGSPVGTTRTTYYAETFDGRPVVRIEIKIDLNFLRNGQQIAQEIREVMWETADGEVVRFETFLLAGSAPQVVTGVVSGGEATITLRTAGKTEIERLQWPAGTGGSTAAEDSLRRRPLAAGETRKLTTFMPVINRIAVVTLTAGEKQSVDVGGVRRDLQRIDSQSTILNQPPVDAVLWCDAQGEVWKIDLPAMQQTSVRTATAQTLTSPKFDIGTSTMIRVEPPIADAHHSQLVRYKVRLRDGDAAAGLPASAGQAVKKLDDGAAEITVVALRPTSTDAFDEARTLPTDGDRNPSALVQSDDARVKALAQAVGGNNDDPWDVAVRAEKLVSEKMQSVNFSTAFATAAETAKTLSGDCTEHAVLLCAILRARGIPARTVVGLVYVEPQQSFGYHMWTEAWINDRWLALDATLGRGGISAAYLRVAATNLEGVDSFAAFLPVFPLLGRLQIEVLERK
jgi:hypothetical protein